ncbi:MAG: hypothetical protein WBE13_17195 [Candidatus Acidiferrum sp.]
MITEDLAISLLSSNQHHVVAKRRTDIEWALMKYWSYGPEFDEEYGEIIAAILLFDAKYGHTPSRKELADFRITEGFDPHTYGKSGDVVTMLKDLPESSSLTETEPLITSFLDTARRIHLRSAYAYAEKMAAGGAKIFLSGDKHRPATLEDSKAFVMKAIAGDLASESAEPEGMVHLNAEILRQDLKDALRPKTKDRMYLPWPHVNECVDLTGIFCTSGSEREFTLKERWYADKEIQTGADCHAAAAD